MLQVLVHCAMGINRSGAMCCAYLMADEKMPLLDAFQRMKHARGMVLCNRSFQKQLLRYARQKGHLQIILMIIGWFIHVYLFIVLRFIDAPYGRDIYRSRLFRTVTNVYLYFKIVDLLDRGDIYRLCELLQQDCFSCLSIFLFCFLSLFYSSSKLLMRHMEGTSIDYSNNYRRVYIRLSIL